MKKLILSLRIFLLLLGLTALVGIIMSFPGDGWGFLIFVNFLPYILLAVAPSLIGLIQFEKKPSLVGIIILLVAIAYELPALMFLILLKA